MKISGYYMALNMLNDLSWTIVAAGDDAVSSKALRDIDDIRATLLDAVKKDAITPPVKDIIERRSGSMRVGDPLDLPGS